MGSVIFLAGLIGLFAINHLGIIDLSGGLGKLLDLVLVYPALVLLIAVLPVLLLFSECEVFA